jgi:hypothetical protein
MRNPQIFRWAFLLAAAGIVGFGAVHALRAQAPATDTKAPAFEVASVKPNKSGLGSIQRVILAPGDRVIVTNETVRTLIQAGYPGILASQIIGGPNWVSSDFDISAKAEAPSPRDLLQSMLRTLLAERFKLAPHRDRKRPDLRTHPGPERWPAWSEFAAHNNRLRDHSRRISRRPTTRTRQSSVWRCQRARSLCHAGGDCEPAGGDAPKGSARSRSDCEQHRA